MHLTEGLLRERLNSKNLRALGSSKKRYTRLPMTLEEFLSEVREKFPEVSFSELVIYPASVNWSDGIVVTTTSGISDEMREEMLALRYLSENDPKGVSHEDEDTFFEGWEKLKRKERIS